MDKLSEMIRSGSNSVGYFHVYNVGVALIRKVWCDLKMPELLRNLLRSRNVDYPYDQTAYLLSERSLMGAADNLLAPAHTTGKYVSIIDHSEIDRPQDLYQTLELLKEDKEAIVNHLNREIQGKAKKENHSSFLRCSHLSF